MGHGTSVGVVDDAFKARISELEAGARALANQFRRLDSARPWMVPKVFLENERDVLDVPALDEPAWNRNNINQVYSEKAFKGPGDAGGTVGDLAAMKWQADFMAVEERAFRLRHASYARCASLMHGRLDGHGKPDKGIFSFLRGGVETLIAAGKANGADDGRAGTTT